MAYCKGWNSFGIVKQFLDFFLDMDILLLLFSVDIMPAKLLIKHQGFKDIKSTHFTDNNCHQKIDIAC